MEKEKKMTKTPFCNSQNKNHEYNWKNTKFKGSN